MEMKLWWCSPSEGLAGEHQSALPAVTTASLEAEVPLAQCGLAHNADEPHLESSRGALLHAIPHLLHLDPHEMCERRTLLPTQLHRMEANHLPW